MSEETIGELYDRLPMQEPVHLPGEALMINWQDITPADAVKQNLDLTERLDITAPLNENGERCEFPWIPQILRYAPIGQYHCEWCGAMVLAGVPHLDYSEPLPIKDCEL